MCAVAYAGRTGSHNLAVAWGIAVTLGIVSTKAGKCKELWHYILTDLLNKVKAGRNFHSINVVHGAPDTSTERDMRHLLQTGLVNPEVTIINSITSCQRFIDAMVRLPESVLASLYKPNTRPQGLFSTEATSTSPWQPSTKKTMVPPTIQDTVHQPIAVCPSLASPIETCSSPKEPELDSTCSSMLTPKELTPYTQSSLTQGSLHLHLEATLPTQASEASDPTITLETKCTARSPTTTDPLAHFQDVLSISDGDTEATLPLPSPDILDLTDSQPPSQAPDTNTTTITLGGLNPTTDILVAMVTPYMDSTPTDARDPIHRDTSPQGAPASPQLRVDSSVRKAGTLPTAAFHQFPITHQHKAAHRAPSQCFSLSPISSEPPNTGVDTPPGDIPSPSPGSFYQDAQRPFSPTDDEDSIPSTPKAPPKKVQTDLAMDTFQCVPLGSLTLEDFTHKTIHRTHPTEVRHLPLPHLASLRCTITQLDHSSEPTERLI